MRPTPAKQSYLNDNPRSYQLSVDDIRTVRDYYHDKYKISIIINGETPEGKEFIKKKLEDVDKKIEHYNKYPYAAYIEANIKNGCYDEKGEFFQKLKNIIPKSAFKFKRFDFVPFTKEVLNEIEEKIRQDQELKNYIDKYKDGYPDSLNAEKDKCCVDLQMAYQEVQTIQKSLTDKEAVGYVYTNQSINGKRHFEVLIITPNQLLKPVSWGDKGLRRDGFYPPGHLAMPHLTYRETGSYQPDILLPQSDTSSCGALGLSYLKELLRDDAEQLTQGGLAFEYYDGPPRGEKFKYTFFLSSPQTLRYSQSSFFNEVLAELLRSDEDSITVKKNNKTHQGPSIRKMLIDSIDYAKKNGEPEIAKKNQAILNNLADFRVKWLKEYAIQMEKHNEMKKNDRNRYLAYKTCLPHQILKSSSIHILEESKPDSSFFDREEEHLDIFQSEENSVDQHDLQEQDTENKSSDSSSKSTTIILQRLNPSPYQSKENSDEQRKNNDLQLDPAQEFENNASSELGLKVKNRSDKMEKAIEDFKKAMEGIQTKMVYFATLKESNPSYLEAFTATQTLYNCLLGESAIFLNGNANKEDINESLNKIEEAIIQAKEKSTLKNHRGHIKNILGYTGLTVLSLGTVATLGLSYIPIALINRVAYGRWNWFHKVNTDSMNKVDKVSQSIERIQKLCKEADPEPNEKMNFQS